jgi:outer membrane protein assembly factor BamB
MQQALYRLLLVVVAAIGLGSCSEPVAPRAGSAIIWRVPSGPPELPLVPVANVDRSMVYFGTPDHRLKKLRGSDGGVMWDVPINSTQIVFPRMGAILSGGVVALSLVDIVAFDTTTGRHRWTYAPPNLEDTGDGPLAANETTIFAASRAGRVHAIDALTGTPRWIVDLAEGKRNVGMLNPTLDRGLLFVCSKDYDAVPSTGKLWALDASTGAVRWSHAFTPAFKSQGAACYGSTAI